MASWLGFMEMSNEGVVVELGNSLDYISDGLSAPWYPSGKLGKSGYRGGGQPPSLKLLSS